MIFPSRCTTTRKGFPMPLLRLVGAALTVFVSAPAWCQQGQPGANKSMSTATWTPDNGNGTFTNPLFYDEFSDPDLIRVGDWFYLTGTTMHAMPGLHGGAGQVEPVADAMEIGRAHV